MKTTTDLARPEAKLETPPLPQKKGDGAWLFWVTLGVFAVGVIVLCLCRVPVTR